jgi:ankyrin repeat protein
MSSSLTVSASKFVTATDNAIDNNNLTELQQLLSIDESVINKKYRGDTAIMKASRRCDGSNVVAFLLENGANINDKEFRDEIDQTPLIVAAQGGCKEIVEMLLQAGADIEHRNDQGENALISAAQEGHKEIVQILLDAGANINQENADGETALDLAIRLKQKKDVINLLLEHGALASDSAKGKAKGKGFKKKVNTRKRRNKKNKNKNKNKKSRKQSR